MTELDAKYQVYKLIELIGTSTTTMEDAIHNAVARAGATVKNMRWFEVTEVQGDEATEKEPFWQVKLKVGFTVEEPQVN